MLRYGVEPHQDVLRQRRPLPRPVLIGSDHARPPLLAHRLRAARRPSRARSRRRSTSSASRSRALEDPGAEISGVAWPRILEVRPHPNADKLQLCDIEFGDGTTTVVCGAPNIAAGHGRGRTRRRARPCRAASRSSGARSAARSATACCARRASSGSATTTTASSRCAADAELGTDVRDVLGLARGGVRPLDHAEPPRRDVASSGVARDLAAHFGLPFTAARAVGRRLGRRRRHHRGGRRARPRARASPRGASGVTMGPSPEWMQRRLTLAGMRPISQRRRRHQLRDARTRPAVARVRPRPAARAAASSCGSRPRARRSRRSTASSASCCRRDLLICDADRRPQAIAGIMGGAEAEVHDGTTEHRAGGRRTSRRWASR